MLNLLQQENWNLLNTSKNVNCKDTVINNWLPILYKRICRPYLFRQFQVLGEGVVQSHQVPYPTGLIQLMQTQFKISFVCIMNSSYVREQKSLETILLMRGGEYRMVTSRLFWGFQNSRLRFKRFYQFRARDLTSK